MSDQTTTPPAGDTAPATTPAPAPAPGPVPYERFSEVNRSYQELKTKLDTIEAAQKQAGEAKLADEGKYKDLLAARDKELADERAVRQRLSVAAKKGLVGELAGLAERLRGTTEAELEADADALLALTKRPSSPGVPLPGGGGRPAGQLDLNSMTPKEIREAMAKGTIKLS